MKAQKAHWCRVHTAPLARTTGTTPRALNAKASGAVVVFFSSFYFVYIVLLGILVLLIVSSRCSFLYSSFNVLTVLTVSLFPFDPLMFSYF